MSGALGQCTCSIAFAMLCLPLPIAERALRRQRLFDREKIPPGKALLQRLAQEISGMQRRHRADLARAGVKGEPAPARLEDAVLAVEQRLGRRIAEADQDVGVGELDLAQREWQADRGFLRRGRAIAGGRQGTMLAIETEVRSSPIAAIMRSSSLPERPTNGSPSMSSSRPGASPTNMTRACGLPSAKTSWVAVARNAQPSKRSSIARSSTRLAALFAAARAAITAAAAGRAGSGSRAGTERAVAAALASAFGRATSARAAGAALARAAGAA